MTATVRPRARSRATSALVSVDLPTPGGSRQADGDAAGRGERLVEERREGRVFGGGLQLGERAGEGKLAARAQAREIKDHAAAGLARRAGEDGRLGGRKARDGDEEGEQET
jgi:hypothetical protein